MLLKIIFYSLTIIFLHFNYKIVISDLKYKKIPNKYLKYLLLLIPFYYIYIFFTFPEINYLSFFWQILITFLVSFILYYFWIWAPWDAKYLLVLALFIPYIWIIPFIGNIALVTILYLLLYFIYFYFYKITFNKQYRQSLWWNIKNDLKDKWKVYKNNKNLYPNPLLKGEKAKTFFIIFKWLIIFLLIFVSIRLIRLYLLHWIITSWQNSNFEVIKEIIEKYNIYLVFLFIWIFIWGLILFRIWINKLKSFIVKKFKLNLILVWNILLWFLAIFLISFITYEYLKNPYEIKNYLFKIFTIYLILYILFKILKAAYKITFWIAEYQYININNLKEDDIVDKEYLVKMFGEQLVLWFTESKKEKKQRKKYLLFPSPKNYFTNIDNPINNETLKIIKKSYFITNKYHKKYTPNFRENNIIKVLNTFSFAPYILWWFILTFFFQDKIFKNILNLWIEFLKNFIQE